MFKQPQIKAKFDGTIRYNDLRLVTLEDGNNIVLNKNGTVSILADDGRELEQHNIVIGAVISVHDGAQGQEGRDLRPVGSRTTSRFSPRKPAR